MGRTPVAVIDLGSNSARIVVFRIAAGRCPEVIADEHAPLWLIRELDGRGRLRRRAVERTIRVLRDFRQVGQGAGAQTMIALGTAALREATDVRGLFRRARAEAGVEIEILDAAAEARAGFLGAVYGLPVRHGLVFDIGGGSLEITHFRNRALRRTWSLPLGALRLSDRFLTSDPPSAGQIRKLRAHVHGALDRAGVPVLGKDEVMVATGGTVRNLAKVDARRREYPIPRLHGYEVTRLHLREITALLAGCRSRTRAVLPGLNLNRAESIVGGSIVTECVLDICRGTRFLVAGQGLREGVVLDRLGIGLPSPQQVRARSVAALIANFTTSDPERARRRRDLALVLYKSLEPRAEPILTEMLTHAAELLDIGKSVDFYRLQAHTAIILRASGLLGFSHREIALLSAMVELADEAGWNLKRARPLLQKEDHGPLERAGLALSLADVIEQRLPPGRAARTTSRSRAGAFVVYEPALAAWEGLELRARFRKTFGRELQVASEPRPRTGAPRSRKKRP
jgi:exopolyphosphatase / guanosine-5'-triphosphate,3'-diphosphate pyrophosphatase